jgi:hypothetical protein
MKPTDTEDAVRTLTEVLDIISVWDQVIMQGKEHPSADCLGDLEWLSVVENYLDGATLSQLAQAWYPDPVPEGYIARPLQRQAILSDFKDAIDQAWRFRESASQVIRETGGRQLDNDLLRLDAYLWLLKDEEAIRERRAMWSSIRALSWISKRYIS